MGMTAAPTPSSPTPTDREQWPSDHRGGDQQSQMVTSSKVTQSHSRAGGNERTPEEQLQGDSMGKKWEKMLFLRTLEEADPGEEGGGWAGTWLTSAMKLQ